MRGNITVGVLSLHSSKETKAILNAADGCDDRAPQVR